VKAGKNYRWGNTTMQQLEIWFADEARIGQKNKITRRWAKRTALLPLPGTFAFERC
jgi:hypothetical protein